MRPFALFALLLVCPALAAEGPAPLPLSLPEATRRALSKNQDIAIERETLVQADEAVRGSKGAFDPLLGLDTGYRQHTDPVNSLFSGAPAGHLGPTTKSFSFSASLSQLLPTGGSVSIFTTAGRDSSNGVFTILSPAWSSSLGISLRQPLLHNLAIDPARRAIRIAVVARDSEAARLRRTVTDTVSAVESTYWELVAARRSVEVIESSVALARQQLSETQSRIDAGVLARTDLAQPTAELERRRGSLVQAREAASRSANALRLLVLSEVSDPDWERDILPTDEPSTPLITVDLAAAMTAASRNRPELFENAALVAQSGIEIEARKEDVLPKLDVVASYARRGLGGGLNPDATSFNGGPVVAPAPISGGLGRSLGTIGENRFPDASIGLSFSVPILNRTARAGLASARSQQRQAQLAAAQIAQRVGAEVRNAAFAVETARQRLEAARAGRAAAETQLFAEQERFSVGLSTNFFVLTRQNELTSARVAEVTAQTDYRRAAAELARATGTLLEERSISLSSSTSSESAPR